MTSSTNKHHLLIIGGGSAAFSAAIHAHGYGARVTIVNAGLPLGGTCVNVGCVPSKTLLRAAEAHHGPTHHGFAGIEGESRLADFRQVIEQKRELVRTLSKEKYRDVIEPLEDVEIIEERGRLVGPRTVDVGGARIKADSILIATGVSPMIPPIPGLADVDYLTNETAFELEELPKSLAIVGGNYVGLETAQLFARLGSEVTVLEYTEQILPTETPDIADELASHFHHEGIAIWTGANTLDVSSTRGGVLLKVEVGNETRELVVEKVLVATGRSPNTKDLGLDEAGVEIDEKGFIKVDAFLETSSKGIYGAGDVIGHPQFVYTAAYEGKLAARHAAGKERTPVDYSLVPWVAFTDPQVAGVGLDEREAAGQGFSPQTTILTLSNVPRSIAARDTRGFIKLIRDEETDRLLGARIVAPEGSELLMELALAIKYEMTTAEPCRSRRRPGRFRIGRLTGDDLRSAVAGDVTDGDAAA
ncbi:MAG: mercury(II) reductase, partial [Bradymonadaceae bacterium]